MRATRRDNYLAIVIILGIAATLWLRVWADHRADSIYGPKLVAANLQSTYVVMNGHLYHLDRSGAVQNAVSLDSIGFSETPCDMQAIEDGRLLVGNREERTIYVCDAGLLTCRLFYALPAAGDRTEVGRIAEERAFDFYFEVATERLFIVDAVRSEFTIISIPDEKRSLVLDQEDLSLPSAIWVDHKGLARIADTVRQQIIGVATESSQFKSFYTGYPGRSEVARNENYFPIDLIQGPHKEWWVINAGPRLMRADLLRYDSDGIPRQRIDLPDDAQPASLALFANRLLVADPFLFTLFSVNLEDATVERFGAQPFTDEAVYFKQRADSYRNISSLALICLIIFVLFCFVLFWKVKHTGREDTRSAAGS